MARIVRFHKTGGPEVLQIEDIPVLPPIDDEVQIKVKAIGLNRAEAMFRSGSYLVKPTFPSRIGYEASGIVEAVGPLVSEFSPGDIVSIVPHDNLVKNGVYGEIATVPKKFIVKHPSTLSFSEAAAIWMQYLTAYGALIDIADIQKDDYVAIPAASSSVGLAAIELCNLVGAIPIALTRTDEKRDELLKAGAKFVIATEEEDIPERLIDYSERKGVRVVFDPVGGKNVIQLAKGASYMGILFQYGGLSAEPTPFPLMIALSKSLTMRGYVLFELINDEKRFSAGKKYIIDALEKGALKPIIAKEFPFEEIVEAHRYLESNQQIGKIIVRVD